MQYVDNDMDDLFRRAAENYPLKTVTEDWDDISPFVPAAAPCMTEGKYNRKLPALLLVSVSFFAILLLIMVISPQIGINKEKGSLINIKNQTSFKKTSTNTALHSTGIINQGEKSITPVIGYGSREQINRSKSIRFVTYNKKIKDIVSSEEKDTIRNVEARVHLTVDKKDNFLIGVSPAGFNTLHVNDFFIQNTAATIAATALKPAATVKNLNAGLYFKIYAGLQSNQVKGQGLNKTGFSAGLMAGYQANKKWAVETGIGWSRKYFFTDAKYFNMTKAGSGMPSNMTIKSLTSCSDIFEIPVLIKYNLAGNNSSSWYLTAGISSYIYSSESNDYLAVINGQQQNVQGKYTTNKGYFSAAAQFGLEYEYSISKKTKLSIEPYIQIPLKGIGIGEVQLMTAGLHLGITRNTRR